MDIHYDDKLEQAYIAGFKQAMKLNNLKYDFSRELCAKANFISYTRQIYKQNEKIKIN